jgi:hypothetical protein
MACGVSWYGMVLVGNINVFGMVGCPGCVMVLCMVWYGGVLYGMVWLGRVG